MGTINLNSSNQSNSNNRILIADDQMFNIDALLIILEYYCKFDTK